MTRTSEHRAQRVRSRRLEQDRNLFARLQAAALASRGQAQRLLKSAGQLSVIEWRVLWDLAEAGPLTVTEMANIQRTDHALVSRAIPGMRDKGFVTVTPSDEDRRHSLVSLTPGGAAAFATAERVMQRRRAKLAAEFNDAELGVFLGLIERFERFLEAPVLDDPAEGAA